MADEITDPPTPGAYPESVLAAGDVLQGLLGQVVILDTQGPLLYIGRLERIAKHHLMLCEADVHHAHDSRTTRELYLLETRDLGVRVNRTQVLIDRTAITSVSLLADVRD